MARTRNWNQETVIDYLQEVHDVSRETCDKLAIYASLLEKWQKSINLVSHSTISSLWERHILDSAQLLPYLPKEPRRILDCGSGAGLPAVILAILTDHQIEMAESDTRKCAFMQTALRETGSKALIHNERLEKIAFRDADIITARAFASVEKILELTSAQHKEGQIFWLLKGRTVNEELTHKAVSNKITYQNYDSLVAGDGVITRLTRLPIA